MYVVWQPPSSSNEFVIHQRLYEPPGGFTGCRASLSTLISVFKDTGRLLIVRWMWDIFSGLVQGRGRLSWWFIGSRQICLCPTGFHVFQSDTFSGKASPSIQTLKPEMFACMCMIWELSYWLRQKIHGWIRKLCVLQYRLSQTWIIHPAAFWFLGFSWTTTPAIGRILLHTTAVVTCKVSRFNTDDDSPPEKYYY